MIFTTRPSGERRVSTLSGERRAAMEAPTLRPGAESDLATMQRIAGDSPGAPQWSADIYRRMLSPDPESNLARSLIVAVMMGQVVGFVVGSSLRSVSPPDFEIESLAVHASFRRLGIGQVLLEALVKQATTEGATELRLELRCSNQKALRLYARAQFAAVGIREDYYSDPIEDAILMARTLSPGESCSFG